MPETAQNLPSFSEARELSPDTSIDLAASLLEYLQTHGSGTPRRVVEFIQASWALTDALFHFPVGDASRTEDPIRTYAQAAAKAPPPYYHQSTHGSNSTAPAYPADLDRERAVTVKVGDSATAKNLRRLTNEDLVKRAEKHHLNAAKTAIRPTLASIQFVAAKILRSGDLRLFLRSVKEAEIARTHRDAWVRGFGETARVTLPTWGVVASDMPCKALGPLTDERDRKRIAQELVANNRHAWGESCEVVHVGWLVRPLPGKKTSSIVIEFSTLHHANKAIDAGTVWDFRVSENALYDRASRVVRCNNCQRYGHIGNICPHDTVCGACAGKHETRACPDRDTSRLVPKCANCGGDHMVWFKKCAVYLQEREKALGRAMHRPRYHRTPAYLQDPDGGATGSAALGSFSAESRTETGSEISGGLPVGARAAPRAEGVRSGETSAAARDAPDDSVMEGLRFTGNTPPNETNLPVDTITTESTLSSVPTLLSTLPATTTRQSIASSGTEGTRRSLRLVNRIDRAIMQVEPSI
ncbi:hypothetical protein AARAC_011664 [Aspergillus arachidicola]|uniref:CCHC-type domain-containing protein n=1 Tax=Aspergillus arachidicola TaxID=656916 RepID=A0A2G7G362_9EURO|nr:hypothetical protein AARAC_011664 [Aspergillus arachidicola]